ncbi:hypothetical protein GYMLUDRAFT_85484 [Collybiopsis luxurians FD-317 M1]|uniref:Diels-Alderase N-terminal domain-containing protein n=1 Tax=Collybiopsis luxurians FD-317 M1 TaxID=944289 RepID=A0A0D0BA50_9AGAR|nr:hypothetical protein GYMLUDRAFT_85484 [Collybiopsis luxurians FD-317 M1]
MKLPLQSLLVVTSTLVSSATSRSSTVIIPSTVNDGPTISQYISSSPRLDDNKVLNINATAFGELWYFDVVSSTRPDQALLVAFLASATEGYTPGAAVSSILSCEVVVKNGDNVYAAAGLAQNAEISSSGIGTSGVWNGTGCSFSATKDLSRMTIKLLPPFEITGSITLEPIAPPTLPCGPYGINENMEYAPGFGWTSIVPYAKTTVDLQANETAVQFKADGYHDLNWGDIVFSESVPNYLWARGKLGPYSMVILAGVDGNGRQRTHIPRIPFTYLT